MRESGPGRPVLTGRGPGTVRTDSRRRVKGREVRIFPVPPSPHFCSSSSPVREEWQMTRRIKTRDVPSPLIQDGKSSEPSTKKSLIYVKPNDVELLVLEGPVSKGRHRSSEYKPRSNRWKQLRPENYLSSTLDVKHPTR